MTTVPFTTQILRGDCLDMLAILPERSIDLVFADPPYNLQLQGDLWRPNNTLVDAVDDAWDQFASFEAYDQFTIGWLRGIRRVMKPTATLWVSGTYHNIFRVTKAMQDEGFWLLNTITWYKPNAMPNFRGRRLKNDVEFVVWAKYDKDSRYTFNHHAMKRYNAGKQLGSMWEIPVCAGAERLRDADGHKLHPTQKPEALLERIILASSRPGDLLLDPFLGSGTTGAVARRLNRACIGIERDDRYADAAQQRIDAVQPEPIEETDLTAVKRIPFSALLTHGFLAPGDRLWLDHPIHEAVILENGLLRCGEQTGSIHQLGALLKHIPSCNGWVHWTYADPQTGDRAPLDRLRTRLRMG
jgi:modification methylase